MFERFTTTARSSVTTAYEEALAAGAPEVRVEHLLIGLLESADDALSQLFSDNGLTASAVRDAIGSQKFGSEDAAALESIGIDLAAVTAVLEENFGPGVLDQAEVGSQPRRWFGQMRLPVDPAFKAVLAAAVKNAVARQDHELRAEHLLLAILADDGCVTRRLVPSAPQLRLKVIAALDGAA